MSMRVHLRLIILLESILTPLAASAITPYSITEIVPPPLPPGVNIPVEISPVNYCVDINNSINAQVVCNLTLVQTTPPPTFFDRHRATVKVVGSKIFVWDGTTQKSTWLSNFDSTTPITTVIDIANTINDNGLIGGSTKVGTALTQGAFWDITTGKQTLVGAAPAGVGDLTNSGAYILNRQLFLKGGQPVGFPGKTVLIQAINNFGVAAGIQDFGSRGGIGILYPFIPNFTTTAPLFGLDTIVNNTNVTGLSDTYNNVWNYVITGPGNNYKCVVDIASAINTCNRLTPIVGSQTFGKVKPFIILNAVNKFGVVVGTDGGQAIIVTNSDARQQFLDFNLPPLSGWNALSNATGINDAGQIIGMGITNNRQTAFLMKPSITIPAPVSATTVAPVSQPTIAKDIAPPSTNTVLAPASIPSTGTNCGF